MAFMEDMMDGLPAGGRFEAGEEVEAFAKFLDESLALRGSVSEQRTRLFQLVDHYYRYSRKTADLLRERMRLNRLARAGSSSSGSSEGSSGRPVEASTATAPGNEKRRLRSGRSRAGDGSMDLDEPAATTTTMTTAVATRARQPPEEDEEDEAAAAARAQRWEEEAQTWDLLRRLLPLRYRDKTGTSGAVAGRRSSMMAAEKPPQTRREYWADFVVSEPRASERKTVLEWLQNSASSARPAIDEVVQDLQRSADRGEILAHGWLHTRAAIKQHKRLVAESGPLDPGRPDLAGSALDRPHKLVTQLDPDVAARQTGRKLAPQDAFFEQAIWLGCYELLRRGRSMREIREWCVERTEVWRAASMSALPLSATGGVGGNSTGEDSDGDDDEDVPDFDPLSTVLWRRMCYRLAQDGGSDGAHERAVYGILCGDVASVEAVGQSWDDLTFAKINAELRAQYDAYLIRQADPAEASMLLRLHGDMPSVLDASSGPAFGTMSAQAPSASSLRERDDRLRRAIRSPAKALQAAILDEKLDQYLHQQGALLAERANAQRPSRLIPKFENSGSLKAGAGETASVFVEPSDSHGLRLLAHVLIIVSGLDRLDGKGQDVAALGPLARRHQTEEHVVASYISFLRLARLEELIPLYAARLLGDRGYTSMAYNLIHVEDHDLQVRLLQYMRRLGLDVVQFVTAQPQLFLADLADTPGVCAARQSFSLLQDEGAAAPTLKYGRLLKPGIFGSVPDEPRSRLWHGGAGGDGGDAGEADEALMVVDAKDEALIRAMEWMLLVDGLLLETCDFGVRIYKYFLKNEHLAAARVLTARVPCSEIVRQKALFARDALEDNDNDPAWWDDLFGASAKAFVQGGELAEAEDVFDRGGHAQEPSVQEVAAHARPMFEMECLVNVLDCLETTAFLASQAAKAPMDASRSVAKNIDQNATILKGFVKPLLKGWLLHGEDDPDFPLLRETYLPQVIIGLASTLQFAGTTSSRDYLLECMELASVVAAQDSDVADVLVQTGRMKELVESFASCSKALAIWTSDMKKGPGASSKKLREMGWSRELWSVKP